MSIVSGISTAPGLAPLLNAPRETQQNTRLEGSAVATRVGGVRTEQVLDVPDPVRPVTGVEREANAGQFQDIRASTDSRYSRFVKAVQALRIDPADEILDDRRVAELIAAAEDFFLVDDGIPREVQPLPPDASIKIEPLELEPEGTVGATDEQPAPQFRTERDAVSAENPELERQTNDSEDNRASSDNVEGSDNQTAIGNQSDEVEQHVSVAPANYDEEPTEVTTTEVSDVE
ncbi:MAG: hypothetical protein AAF557_19200 [Pseudomonadota bacterium]